MVGEDDYNVDVHGYGRGWIRSRIQLSTRATDVRSGVKAEQMMATTPPHNQTNLKSNPVADIMSATGLDFGLAHDARSA